MDDRTATTGRHGRTIREAAVRAPDEGPFRDDIRSGMDRRTFVKGAMVGAAIGAAAASGMGMFRQLAQVDPYILKTVTYLGAQQGPTSPAPRGLPLVPVRVNDEGLVEGVPEDGDENYLDWYRYCSHEMTPGLLPGTTEDNVFRYDLPHEKIEKAEPSAEAVYWYHDLLDEPVRAEHFAALPYGSGAAVRWRSEGRRGSDVVTALLLKLDPAGFAVPGETLGRFMDLESGLIGYSTFCTHFCCVPGWKEDPVARRKDWDLIYCGCHGSRFDPRDVREFRFDLRVPRDPA